ncbi:MAG: helix-turn-helix domain-containing protein [Rhizobiaceae bacterium]|nr:helix-turn-helix domain-containing protein [Rhizobiaceae bacterium]
MTPFGEKIRELRKSRNISQKEMATKLNVSAAYLCALEHGQRGKPQWPMVQRIITYFNIIWDEAEELQYLASISDPKATIDTSRLSANATTLANLLARNIADLSQKDIEELTGYIEKSTLETNRRK